MLELHVTTRIKRKVRLLSRQGSAAIATIRVIKCFIGFGLCESQRHAQGGGGGGGKELRADNKHHHHNLHRHLLRHPVVSDSLT